MKAITVKSLESKLFKSLLILLMLPMSHIICQVSTEGFEEGLILTIKMEDGEVYSGELIYMGEEEIKIKTANSQINLLVSEVKEIKKEDYDFSKFRFENPNKTRYFFSPSAEPLEKGEGYYQNVWLSINSVNYGITNNLTIGGGIEFVSTALGEPIWFLNPKIGIPIAKDLHIGGGVLLAGLGGNDVNGMAYGVFTYGNSDASASIGIGKGFRGDGISTVASGTLRLNNSLALLTENYFLPLNIESSGINEYIGIHGIRILSKKNTFDVGALVNPVLSEYIRALPYVGYTRHF